MTFVNSVQVLARTLSTLSTAFLKAKPVSSAIALGATLAGCAIHPVQQDVTHIPTKQIVTRIRCEARLAIQDKAIELLREAYEETRLSRFSEIANEIETGRGGPIRINFRRLPTEEARAFYNRYINTVIAYDFLFNITEDNGAALVADPVRLITSGTVGIGVGASGSLQRNNLRNFALSDTFGGLLRADDLKCESRNYLPADFVHPIAGSVGLRGAIGTFIDLNEARQLSGLGESKANVFADTLKFTTVVGGSIGPHVALDAIGFRWGIAPPTNLLLSAARTDVHTLTIGLAMGVPGRTAGKGASRSRFFTLDSTLGRTSGTSSKATNETEAFEAIGQLRYRNFLERAGTLR